MPVENSDLLRWQGLSYRALGDFLAAAKADGLPAIAWTIASNGALTGTIDSLTADLDGQRATFNVWACRLGARTSERTDRAGVVHLHARFVWAGDRHVVGAIRATLVPAVDGRAVTS